MLGPSSSGHHGTFARGGLRSGVGVRASAAGAERVLDALEARGRNGSERAAAAQPRRVTINQIRERLQVIRAKEEARSERARVERLNLTRIDRPPTIEQTLASARREIQAGASEATQFTPTERARLARLTKDHQSWNPFVRNAAKKEAAKLHAGQQTRYEDELAKATRDFENVGTQRIQERIRSDERIYREYVGASLGLEDQIRKARAVLGDEIPKIEKQLTVLERTGVAQLECEGAVWAAGLDKLAAAVDRRYQALPRELRRDRVCHASRTARSAPSRESIWMDR